MPLTVTAEHPRHPQLVQGVTVQAPHIFAEGHQLSSAEAGFLNRMLANRIGSNVGQKLKKDAEKAKAKLEDHIATQDVQALFDSAFADFDLSAVRGEATAKADPIDVRARQIADKQLRELPKIKAAGVSKLQKAKATEGSGHANKWAELVAQFLAKRPDIRELAASQIEAERALKSGGEAEADSFDDLLADIDTGSADAGAASGEGGGEGAEGGSAPAAE